MLTLLMARLVAPNIPWAVGAGLASTTAGLVLDIVAVMTWVCGVTLKLPLIRLPLMISNVVLLMTFEEPLGARMRPTDLI